MASKEQRKRYQVFVLCLVSSRLNRLASALPPPNRVLDRPMIPTSLASLHNITAVNNTVPTKRKRRRKQRPKDVGDAPIGPVAIESDNKRPTNGQEPTHVSAGKIKDKVGPLASKVKPKESGGREADLLRRIKREWRDAVKLGIAYDWSKMKTLLSSQTVASDKYMYVRIGPLGKHLLRWHFSVMGPPNSDYEGGIYHGRVLLPNDYPASPPRIQVLTPSGRFVTGEDICLSASSFHPESWTPRWTLLSLVDALRLHMLTTANEIGGKNATPDERRRYARASRQWHLGRIDHRAMVQDGIFPWQQDETAETPVQVHDQERDGGVQIMAVKRTAEAQVRKRVPQNAKLSSVLVHAVVEVLTNPRCLALLLVLTVFVILNRH
jgi:ubiquitin-protein ligase